MYAPKTDWWKQGMGLQSKYSIDSIFMCEWNLQLEYEEIITHKEYKYLETNLSNARSDNKSPFLMIPWWDKPQLIQTRKAIMCRKEIAFCIVKKLNTNSTYTEFYVVKKSVKKKI